MVTPLRRALASVPTAEFASCHQQGCANSKTLLHQNPPVRNWGASYGYNGHKNSCCLLYNLRIFRPHCSTTYVDAACCYRLSSVVCLSVGLSVCHSSEPCKNGCTNQDAIRAENLSRPKEPCIRWGSRSPMGKSNFEGGRGVPP